MINLLKPFFRSNIKFILSLVVFIVVICLLNFLIGYEVKINKEMSIIENKENNREITLMLNDESLLKKVEEFDNIEDIEIVKIGNSYIVNVLVETTNELELVVSNLNKLGIQTSLLDNSNQDELNTYKSVKLIFNIFIIIIIAFLMIIIYVQIKLLITWDMNNISLLKVLGYNDFYICNLTVGKLYILVILASVISTMLFILFNLLFELNIIIPLLFMPSIITIILVIIQYPVLLSKIKKINIIYVLGC